MVASDIRIAVGDRARGISVLRAALVFILALAAMSAQAGQAPRAERLQCGPRGELSTLPSDPWDQYLDSHWRLIMLSGVVTSAGSRRAAGGAGHQRDNLQR
jgi:hypothetical protein